jgi:sugar phosphate isomerase/epimerase
MEMKRRRFVKNTSLAITSVHLMPMLSNKLSPTPAKSELPIHLFSKHLQFLDYEQAGHHTAKMGFAGLDLTVRPGGHVLPEQVDIELPKALEAIKRSGSNCRLITTAIEDNANTLDQKVLKTASSLGITHYRCNWFKYLENEPMPDTLAKYALKVNALSTLNKELHLTGCYQNHAGIWVGASLWEVLALIKDADQSHFGVQYDIRHAMVEGGLSWENGLRLINKEIKTLVLKDFIWTREQGHWRIQNVPIGEGMVDFIKYFKLIKNYGIDVPVILHAEHLPGGATEGNAQITVPQSVIFEALTKDLKTIQRLWLEA